MPLEARGRTRRCAALDLPPPFRAGDAARGRRRLCACAARSRRRRAPARWSMSAASTLPSSPSCWSRTSRCAPRGARFYAGHGGAGRRARGRTRRRRSRSSSTGRTRSASMAGWSAAGGSPGRRRSRGRSAADWLVFGAMIRTVAMGEDEPGLHPLVAALEEEGFDDVGSGRLVESFARHLMVAIDAWQEQGFGAVAKDYLPRLDARERACAATSTTTATCWCGAWAKPKSSAARWCRRSPAPSWLDPANRRAARDEAAAHHPARSVRHVRVRARRRARRMGGVRRLHVLGCRSGERSKARRARLSAAGSSASRRSAGRRWCRSSRQARRTAPHVVELLAQQLVAHFGAPDLAAARAAAEEEVAFAASLCDHPADTLIAVHRTFEDGEIREAFRTPALARGAEAAARLLVPRSRRREPGEDVEARGEAKRRVDLCDAGPHDEAPMTDFWLSCGHHLLDRDAGGGLAGHRRIPQGLSGAAGACAAAGGLRGRAHACTRRCWPIRAGRSTPPRSRRSRTPMRARTGR